MALINCPECGKQVSSASKSCIHCGCELLVCPECNTAFAMGAEICTNCGYAFKPNKVIEDNEKEERDVIKIYNNWKNKNTINKYLFAPNFIINIIPSVLSSIFFIIALIKFVIWVNGDPLDGILEYKEVLNEIEFLITLAFIAFSCFPLLQILQFFGMLSFNKYVSLNDINIKDSLINYFKIDFPKKNKPKILEEKPTIHAIIYGQILDKNILEKEKGRNTRIFSGILYIVGSIFYGVFMLNLFEGIIQHILYNNMTTVKLLDIVEFWPAIVGASLVIIATLITNNNRKIEESLVKNWGKANLGDDFNNLKKFIETKK